MASTLELQSELPVAKLDYHDFKVTIGAQKGHRRSVFSAMLLQFETKSSPIGR